MLSVSPSYQPLQQRVVGLLPVGPAGRILIAARLAAMVPQQHGGQQ